MTNRKFCLHPNRLDKLDNEFWCSEKRYGAKLMNKRESKHSGAIEETVRETGRSRISTSNQLHSMIQLLHLCLFKTAIYLINWLHTLIASVYK